MVFLTLKAVDQTLVFNLSNESFFCDTVCRVVQSGYNSYACERTRALVVEQHFPSVAVSY